MEIKELENDQLLKICPKCNTKLPIFNEKGMHNFCPASTPNGGIIDICMKCKMDEVKKHWIGS